MKRLDHFDESAERFVIGSVLSTGFVAVAELRISPFEFGSPERQRVFMAAESLQARGEEGTFITIAAKLGMDPRDVLALGSADTSILQSGILKDCAYRMRECYLRRRAYDIGNRLASEEITAEEARLELEQLANRSNGDVFADLDARRFNPNVEPMKPRAAWSLYGQSLGTAGNLVAISAQVKSGKTGFMGALVGSTFDGPGDCFGLDSENPDGRALVHFDTEQSRFDFHRCVQRSITRSGAKNVPAWYRAYSLADVPTSKRLDCLRAEIRRASAKHNGILAVLLDGVADLVADPNDAEEAFAFVDELHHLAIEHDAVIVAVLHENPGSETGKTRGHLGSQLERKAETNLRIVKDAAGVSTVFSEKSRNCHIPKDRGIRFVWSDEHGRHITAPDHENAKVEEQREEFAGIVEEAFRDAPSTGLSWAQAHRKIADVLGMNPDSVRKRFINMVKAGVIRKTPGGFYLSNL